MSTTDYRQSKLTPPPVVFQIVWPILYVSMFVSLGLYLRTLIRKNIPLRTILLSTGLWFFIFQFVFNITWSPVFFGLQERCTSITIILGILLFLLLTMIQFYAVSKPAFYLLLPYALWSIFALYLNVYICLANP